MSSFTGITAARADEVLGQSVVSGAINGAGHLILTRQNGQTIDAGQFTQPVINNWPVGSVFISANNISPAASLGGGTWVQYAKGQVLVGQDDNQTEFSTLGGTGGEKAHTLSAAEMPVHNHPGSTSSNGAHTHSGSTSSNGAHTHSIPVSPLYKVASTSGSGQFVSYSWNTETTGSAGAHTHTFSTDSQGAHTHTVATDNQGGGQAHNNLQPYIVVYMWRRTA